MRITLLNQCFYPDVVATGQHLTDLAVALSDRGHQVSVLTGNRGYDDPARRFAGHEVWKGIKINRLPAPALGKAKRWRRAVNFAGLLIAYSLKLLVTPRQDVVVALTSPPLVAFLAAVFVKLKGGRLIYWIMDLNPDEALAAGWLRKDALVTRALDGLQNFALRTADRVVVLDRFMCARIIEKGIAPDRVTTISPWPLDDAMAFDQTARESFRLEHQLQNKFVVMYAGNHSPCHPLETLLEAAEQLRDDPELLFCFVGGGSEFAKVQQFAASRSLPNILCLPYQPRAALAGSLSAADLHVIIMGEPFVGIVHPCKIYNVLRVASPFLYIGPTESHVTDLVGQLNGDIPSYVAQHGAVGDVVQQITDAAKRNGIAPERKTSHAIAGDGLEKLIGVVEAVGELNTHNDSVAAANSPAPATVARN